MAQAGIGSSMLVLGRDKAQGKEDEALEGRGVEHEASGLTEKGFQLQGCHRMFLH